MQRPQTWQQADMALYPRIQDPLWASTAALLARAAQIETVDGPSWNLTPKHRIELECTVGGERLPVVDSDLARWGVDAETAHESAVANISTFGPPAIEQIARGLYRVAYDDDWATARLLTPYLFTHATLRGDPIAVALSERVLLVGDSAEPAALLDALASLADRLAREKPEHAPPCGEPIVWRRGVPELFEPGSPALATWRVALARAADLMQRPLWTQIAAHEEPNVFVAGVGVVADRNGRPWTYSVCGLGVGPTLCQATDLVVFGVPDPAAGSMHGTWSTWQRIQGVLDDDLVQWGNYEPMRLCIQRFPTPAELPRLAIDFEPAQAPSAAG